MELKERIKQLREDNNKTQKEVALTLGIKEQAYQRYEYGTSIPKIDIIIKLSNLYNVTTDYILKGK